MFLLQIMWIWQNFPTLTTCTVQFTSGWPFSASILILLQIILLLASISLANHLTHGFPYSCKSPYSCLSLFLQIILLMAFAFLPNHLTHVFRFSCKSSYSRSSLRYSPSYSTLSLSLYINLFSGHLFLKGQPNSLNLPLCIRSSRLFLTTSPSTTIYLFFSALLIDSSSLTFFLDSSSLPFFLTLPHCTSSWLFLTALISDSNSLPLVLTLPHFHILSLLLYSVIFILQLRPFSYKRYLWH